MATPRLMLVLLGASALVVAAIAALALGAWWIFAVVLAFHAIATLAVVGYSWQRAGEAYDKPDPVTEAQLEEDRSEDELAELRRRGRGDVFANSQR